MGFVGSLETISMTEQIMEQIAYELNLGLIRVRMNNLSPQATDTADVIQTLLRDSEYEKRKEEVEKFNKLNRWKKRGLRVAFMSWPGVSFVDFHVLMSVFHGDGSVMITHGGVEIGQGINTKVIPDQTRNDQEPFRSSGAAVAEVELDILTGEHEILRVDIVEDCGTSINPELDIGQIEGGFMFGVGYWTHEDLIYDEKTGELLTDRSWNYKVPLAKDIPIDFRIQLRRNSYNPLGVLGSRAVSEPPTCLSICVAFALREAIVSAREDTGHPREKWFSVDGPFTLSVNVLKSDANLKEFLFN